MPPRKHAFHRPLRVFSRRSWRRPLDDATIDITKSGTHCFSRCCCGCRRAGLCRERGIRCGWGNISAGRGSWSSGGAGSYRRGHRRYHLRRRLRRRHGWHLLRPGWCLCRRLFRGLLLIDGRELFWRWWHGHWYPGEVQERKEWRRIACKQVRQLERHALAKRHTENTAVRVIPGECLTGCGWFDRGSYFHRSWYCIRTRRQERGSEGG